ncbi:hypothetical protein [Phenylobacterium soli]|uniref:Uncharacterized protein n=1 Tax=Phenylobacterium soli TaxID=2170551 RepID=A0A328AAH7_9CAUL|nr:hypothetical protein [Phenylobacterium soli]RAK51611.1 hypothetical protein DJ017_17395 [Phenylobacterium soli]
MTLTADSIMHLDGQLLPFSRDLREALAIYARRTWPVNTSGHAAKAWGIPKTTAANLLKGHASDATVTKIIRAGGWELALPVIGAVIGEPVHAFFREQMRQAAREAERAKAHEELAQAAYRHLATGLADPGEDRRSRRRA